MFAYHNTLAWVPRYTLGINTCYYMHKCCLLYSPYFDILQLVLDGIGILFSVFSLVNINWYMVFSIM